LQFTPTFTWAIHDLLVIRVKPSLASAVWAVQPRLCRARCRNGDRRKELPATLTRRNFRLELAGCVSFGLQYWALTQI
jgi:hypothetical protein